MSSLASMSNGALAVLACAVLALGLGGAIALAKLGVPRTYVRDLVHVGTGVWVLGWPLWRSPTGPIAITSVAALVVLAGPRVLRDALTGDDERWSGVAVYVVVYAVFTAIGFLDRAVPAGAGLLALSLGDGLGGLVGRRFGRWKYRAPGAKLKSVEGSLTVFVMASVGVAAAGVRGVLTIALAGLVAALAEALSPRGTDNAVVPASVWLFLRFV